MPPILVIGATGKVGRRVVAGLLERRAPVRAMVRDCDAARLPDAVEVVGGDLSRPQTLAAAVDGADAVFLVWPFLSADRAGDVVEALAAHGRRVVYLSAEAAGRRADSSWAQVERIIEHFASDWTFLRPTGFAANTLMWVDQIRRGDVVRWVYGQAARSLIDERDIATVAVRALVEDRHGGKRHVLTGPETITQARQVRTIGEALGRQLRWEELSPEEVSDQLGGVPDTALQTWAGFVDSPEVVTATVREITGRPAGTFAEWARENAQAFM